MERVLLVLLLPLVLGGWIDTPRCLWTIQTRFFEPRTVKEAFDLYRVFQSQWTPILSDILRKSQQVPQRVRNKARRMHPDPFEHPSDVEKIKALIYETEFEIFREALVENYYYDLSAAYGMFDYIRSAQQKWVDACLGTPGRANKAKMR